MQESKPALWLCCPGQEGGELIRGASRKSCVKTSGVEGSRGAEWSILNCGHVDVSPSPWLECTDQFYSILTRI